MTEDPDKHHTIEIEGKELKVKAGDIAKGLINAYLTTSNDTDVRAETGGGELAPRSGAGGGRAALTIKRPVITRDRSGGTRFINRDLAKTFIHEGIHTVPGERVFRPLRKSGKFRDAHITPYNNASTLFYHNYRY